MAEKITDPELTDSSNSSPTDWEARFKGLQAAMAKKEQASQAQQQKAESTIAQMTVELNDRTAEVTGFTADLDKIRSELEGAKKQNAELAEATAKEKARIARWEALAEFPELMPHEKAGRLRTDLTGDELVNHLKDFQALLGGAQQQGRQAALSGASSANGSTRQPPADRKTLMAQLIEAQRKNDSTAYQAAYQAILALDQK